MTTHQKSRMDRFEKGVLKFDIARMERKAAREAVHRSIADALQILAAAAADPFTRETLAFYVARHRQAAEASFTNLTAPWHNIGLTERQAQVMHLLMRGLGNRAVGEELGCAVKTVEKHRMEIYSRLGINQFYQLGLWYWFDILEPRKVARGSGLYRKAA